MGNKKLKTMAKNRLKGKYSIIIFGLILFMLLEAGCMYIAQTIKEPWISPLLIFVINSLIIMGFIGVVLNIARKNKITVEELLARTDQFDKYMLITLILAFGLLIIYLLGYLSFKSMIMIIIYHTEINLLLAILLIIFGLFLTVAVIIVGIYYIISFSQAYFILYDEPKLKVTKILEKSFDMMEGYILQYLLLILSFTGWAIVGIFTLGILYLWLIPYALVTIAIFYDKVKKSYEKMAGEKKKSLVSKK